MPGDLSKGKMSRRRTSLEEKEEDVELTLYHDNKTASNSGSTSHGKKRKGESAILDEASSTSDDVEKLLVGFGANFTKTIQNKKRKIETFTKESLEYSKRKMKEVNTKQSADRQVVLNSYTKQVDVILGQWEEDLGKMKEGEEKLSLVMKQFQTQSRQQRLAMLQKYKTMKQLKDEFAKSIDQLQETHDKQLSSIHDEMKEEMAQLRKKVMMESQQHEMSTVKNSLTKLLASMGEE
ncbi:PREDICTED: synaptonemal complex protein 3-like [Amphimedon queenslandica]|uniref:XLR/SYCP3/FAM9 domain-containing protein n=1 Tax=Amphimedon queenslandica TaxID=400682 RepID=A0A1X7ULU6_AMPQE|nr:PREDICTED: synaptonemal complex protein 3-like [Amphimedon queenslandica]|eukprot:XP_003387517.1 PREDICTED: synaptonemal complex protein 3-like [Amphimedon queenslandica]